MQVSFLAAIIVCLFYSMSAEAHGHHSHRYHHRHYRSHSDLGDTHQSTFNFFSVWQQPSVEQVSVSHRAGGGEIVSHPSDCPHTAFCGCGVAQRVFGHTVRSLWLAANWYRFPRTVAAAGMVAIFGRHHVAYIESVNSDGTATLYDPNSGGHLTRIHTRRIAGATIVNPRGA